MNESGHSLRPHAPLKRMNQLYITRVVKDGQRRAKSEALHEKKCKKIAKSRVPAAARRLPC